MGVLFGLYLLTAAVRIWSVRDAQFPFWFDLGRDAIISRQIVEQRDLKVQGPSASGSGDTIFHGVMYYYIVGPLYSFLDGDPRLVMIGIILLSSTAVVPVYLLAQALSGRRGVAILAGVLYSFSYEAVRSGTWLSNPVIATVSLPWFFYLWHQVFLEHKRHWLPWLTLSLAITQQSVILFAPWWGLVALGFWWQAQQQQLKQWRWQTLGWAAVAYLLGVSTMILAQLKAFLAGIFTLGSVAEYAAWSGTEIDRIVDGTQKLFLAKLVLSLTPTFPVMALALAAALLWFLTKKTHGKAQLTLALLASSPLWLLLWHYRNMYHTFITVEVALLIAMSWFVVWLWEQRAGKLVALGLVAVFVFSNYQAYSKETTQRQSLYFVPQGAYLKEQLAAIDFTYQSAAGLPFSISTITNPYGYNTLWAYLYHWYGQTKYGYVPTYFGPDQTGIIGGDLLENSASPSAHHFSLYEPDQGMPGHLYTLFEAEQEKISTPSAKHSFGTLQVHVH